MKILHIIGDANFGGIGTLVITLVQQQLKAGNVTPSILFANTMRGDFLDKFENTGARLLTVNCRRGYDVSVKKYKYVSDVFKDVDVLHFHYFNPFLAWCAVHIGKNIVYTEHGNFGFGRKTTVSDRIKRRLLKKFLNDHVDHISFNSEFTKKTAECRYGLSETSRSTIYNGIDLDSVKGYPDHVEPDIKSKLEGKFVVGTCSRFAGFKRIDRLIEAYSCFQEGRDNAVLLLVGDGVLRPQLEEMSVKLGIEEQVIFTGYRHNANDYQGVMDVCVYPSENEPFGLVAVESLLLGKPTLVLKDGGGLNEIIGGISGSDVATGIQSLSKRIEYYYKHREELCGKSEIRKQYGSRFNAEKMEIEFFNTYKKIS